MSGDEWRCRQTAERWFTGRSRWIRNNRQNAKGRDVVTRPFSIIRRNRVFLSQKESVLHLLSEVRPISEVPL
jgi:hypothetical protein